MSYRNRPHICPVCANPFFGHPGRKHCSLSCASKGRYPTDPTKHPRYKGGLWIGSDNRGWITLRSGRSYPFARAVVEAYHGPIPSGSVVHHVNGDPSDDHPENLQVLTRSEHAKAHAAETAERTRRMFAERRAARWAQDHDACKECGMTERPHHSRGLCDRCRGRLRARASRAAGLKAAA